MIQGGLSMSSLIQPWEQVLPTFNRFVQKWASSNNLNGQEVMTMTITNTTNNTNNTVTFQSNFVARYAQKFLGTVDDHGDAKSVAFLHLPPSEAARLLRDIIGINIDPTADRDDHGYLNRLVWITMVQANNTIRLRAVPKKLYRDYEDALSVGATMDLRPSVLVDVWYDIWDKELTIEFADNADQLSAVSDIKFRTLLVAAESRTPVEYNS